MLKLLYREAGTTTEREFIVKKGSYRLGRDAVNDIVIADERISREHARIGYEDGRAVIVDLGSTGGIYRNGRRIAGREEIGAGDLLLLGLTEIKVVEAVTATPPDGDEGKTIVMNADELRRQFGAPAQNPVAQQPPEAPGGAGATEEDLSKTSVINSRAILEQLRQNSAQGGPGTAPASGEATSRVQGPAPVGEQNKPRSVQAAAGAGASPKSVDPPEPSPVDGVKRFDGAERTAASPRGNAEAGAVANSPAPAVAKTAPAVHRLVVVSQKGAGREYPLDKATVTLGRSPECDVFLDDTAVSTRHATIRRESGGAVIVDEGSTNGTFVNGRRVRKEKKLAGGETIEIGSTSLKFVAGGSSVSGDARADVAAKPAAPRPGRRKMIVVLAVFCALLTLMAVVGKMRGTGGGGTPQPTPVAVKAPAVMSEAARRKEAADAAFRNAQELVTGRLWGQAAEKFTTALKADPDYPGARDGLRLATLEKDNAATMAKGTALLGEGKVQEGAALLRSIPAQSVYSREADLEIQRAQADSERQRQRETDQAAARSDAAARRKKGADLLGQALADYRGGDTGQCFAKFKEIEELGLGDGDATAIKARESKEKIKKVMADYGTGLAQYQAKQYDTAFATWSAVLQLDKELVGDGKSQFALKIGSMVAAHLYTAARAAYDLKLYDVAGAECRKVLKADPQHKGAREIEAQLLERAKKLYEEGYILEDLDPVRAVAKWNEVLTLCAEGSEYHQKAKAKLVKYLKSEKGGSR